MSTNRDDILKQFCDVTGTDENRSKFFLESSNWQLEVALSSFFEHGGNAEDNNMPSLGTGPAAQVQVSSDTDSPPQSPVTRKKKNKNPKSTTRSAFATLASIQKDSSSDEDEGEAFYAGGSVRSGQQILGPKKGNKDIVSEVFKSVKDQGAVAMEDEPATSRGHTSTFTGTGYRLGQTPDDHEVVANTRGRQSQENIRTVRIMLYPAGFTVDNGPLRLYTEPENIEFINYIRRAEIPPELSSGGTEVRVSLEDRRDEECPKQMKSKAAAFSGKGHMLGSPTPPTVGGTEPEPTTPDREANQRAAQTAVNVNDGLPTTTIQFRLSDGSRISGRFNHSHTVGDLRQYLITASPSAQLQNFVLMTTFPSAELTDPSVTLEQAKLLNSVVVQRIK